MASSKKSRIEATVFPSVCLSKHTICVQAFLMIISVWLKHKLTLIIPRLIVRIDFIKRQFSTEIHTIEMDTILAFLAWQPFIDRRKNELEVCYRSINETFIENSGKFVNIHYDYLTSKAVYIVFWYNPDYRKILTKVWTH